MPNAVSAAAFVGTQTSRETDSVDSLQLLVLLLRIAWHFAGDRSFKFLPYQLSMKM
jgi:hypothetical protein